MLCSFRQSVVHILTSSQPLDNTDLAMLLLISSARAETNMKTALGKNVFWIKTATLASLTLRSYINVFIYIYILFIFNFAVGVLIFWCCCNLSLWVSCKAQVCIEMTVCSHIDLMFTRQCIQAFYFVCVLSYCGCPPSPIQKFCWILTLHKPQIQVIKAVVWNTYKLWL